MITVGIDEVGRGCWAGPLVAGAIILPESYYFDGPIKLQDSKKLSKKQRRVSAGWINGNADSIGLGWVWPAEIDTNGLTWAVKTAMERAIAEIKIDYDEIIIDGNINYFPDNSRAKAIIKADDSVPAVSAASIVAKVARDEYMANLPSNYEGYKFEKHVGYGTADHIIALKKLGVSDIHRKGYKPVKVFLV